MKKPSGYWISVLLVLLAAACYGVMSPLLKLVYNDGYSFEQITVHQAGASFVLLWVFVLLRPRYWSKHRFNLKQWSQLAFIGIFGLSMTTILYNQTLERLDASFSIVLLFQFMWITIFLESLWKRQRPTPLQWTAIAIAMAGTILAVGLFEHNKWTVMDWIGIVCGLASALTYSLFLFLTGKVQSNYDPVMKSAIMLTFGFIMIAMLYGSKAAVVSGSSGGWEWTLIVWGVVLSLLGQVMPSIFFNAGIPRIGSGLASMLGAMELPIAVISAWLIIGEPISGGSAAGIVLILGGIAVAEYESRQQSAQSEGLEE